MLQIWLDCDPGHDDMLAIIMATMNEKIHVLGISTTAGNSNSDNTTQNALNILGEINKT